MATTRKITMTFRKSNGDKFNLNYNNAKETVTNAQVKSAMEGIIVNGTIFENIPAVLHSAAMTTTNKTEFDLV